LGRGNLDDDGRGVEAGEEIDGVGVTEHPAAARAADLVAEGLQVKEERVVAQAGVEPAAGLDGQIGVAHARGDAALLAADEVLPVQVDLLRAVGAHLLRADEEHDVGAVVAVVVDVELIARAGGGAQRRRAEDARGRVDGHGQDGVVAVGEGVDVVDVQAAVGPDGGGVEVVGRAGAQGGQAHHHGQDHHRQDCELANRIHLKVSFMSLKQTLDWSVWNVGGIALSC